MDQNTNDLIKNDPRFAGATIGDVNADEKDGKMTVQDLGDGLVAVSGPMGDTSVETLDGYSTAANEDLQKTAVDEAIKLSVTDEKTDPRVSTSPDYQSTDGTYVNRDSQNSSENGATQVAEPTVVNEQV